MLLSTISLAGLGEVLLLMRAGDHWLAVMPPNLFSLWGNSQIQGAAIIRDSNKNSNKDNCLVEVCGCSTGASFP